MIENEEPELEAHSNPDKKAKAPRNAKKNNKAEDSPVEVRIKAIELGSELTKWVRANDSTARALWNVSYSTPISAHHPSLTQKRAPCLIIFKCGDDLRQDQLVMQLLQLMNNIWKQVLPKSHPFKRKDVLLTYNVLPTWANGGVVQVVPECRTMADIMDEKNQLRGYLVDKKKQETFLYTVAGYCVASYVLGFGDRHDDNVMVTKDGPYSALSVVRVTI